MGGLRYTKRVWIISDTHLGCRSNSQEWLTIMKDYFYNFFIPLVKKEYKKGDVLFHLGDVFDNRQSTNLFAQRAAIDIFEKLGKIFPEIHILVGNHDIARKLSNDITSVDILKHLPNVYIHKKASVVGVGGAKILIMPWRKNKEHEVETLAKFPYADYVFCHSEVAGLQLSRNPKYRHDGGNSVDEFKAYKKVYSGHIHYHQNKKNFLLVGNPYEMTRSDCGNTKGIYRLDVNTGEETFFENNYSPKFLKLHIKDIFEHRIEDIKKMINNNFVDIYVPSEMVMKYNMSSLMNLLVDHARRVEPHIYENEQEIDMMMNGSADTTGYQNFDIMQIAKKYIEATSYEKPLKKRLMKSLKELYDQAHNN